MKRIISLFLIALMSMSVLTVLAAPSVTNPSTPGGIIVPTEEGDEEIPAEVVEEYVALINVHDARDGSILHEIGKQLKKEEKDNKFSDEKLGEVIGEEYEDQKLIQMFSIDTKKDKIKDNKIVIGDYTANGDGTYTIDNIRVVDIRDGRITMRVDIATVTEHTELRLVQLKNGKWVQADHVRVFNGYITFQLDVNEDDGTVWAVTVDKPPVSPPTGENVSVIPAILIALAGFGIALTTKKYLVHK